MPRFLPDSDCMIAAVSEWHEHHQQAAAELNRRLRAGEKLVLAGPTLMETYSVLTRLPTRRRLGPEHALAIMEETFMSRAEETVALGPAMYTDLVRGAASREIFGGRIYDAVIAACARVAGVEALLTFNERDFLALVVPPTSVVVPR